MLTFSEFQAVLYRKLKILLKKISMDNWLNKVKNNLQKLLQAEAQITKHYWSIFSFVSMISACRKGWFGIALSYWFERSITLPLPPLWAHFTLREAFTHPFVCALLYGVRHSASCGSTQYRVCLKRFHIIKYILFQTSTF